MVNLIEGLLAHIRVSRALLLFEIRFHLLAAVETPVFTICALLRTIQESSIIGIVRIRILELSQVMLPARQECTKEGAGRIVLDVHFDPDILEVRLHNRLVGSAPGFARRCRVSKLQPLSILRTNTIRTFHPAMLIKQSIGGSRVEFRTGSIRLIAGMQRRSVIGTQRSCLPNTGRFYEAIFVNRH